MYSARVCVLHVCMCVCIDFFTFLFGLFVLYLLYSKNIILTNVIEERWVDSSVYNAAATTASTVHHIVVVKRELSQAMIPGKHLVRVQVKKCLYKERVEPILLSESLCE